MVLTAVFFGVIGCSDDGPSRQVTEARQLMQQGEFSRAVDVLADAPSAEAHYLKAAALYQQRLQQSAEQAVSRARQRDAENVKYHALQLGLQLQQGDSAAAEKLVALHKKNADSAIAALFAFYAHQRMARQVGGEKQSSSEQRAARLKKHRNQAVEALRSAIALSAEAPEFQRRMLDLALLFRLGKPAVTLLDKLQKAAPEDSALVRKRVTALLQAEQADAAVSTAEQFYRKENRSEKSAMVYATALAKATANSRRDDEFAELSRRYPVNPSIASLHAVYLARANRHQKAAEVLQSAIEAQDSANAKQHLMRIAISIPLEQETAGFAQRQLQRYRDRIGDPVLKQYYEGRILYLQHKYDQALGKLAQVVESLKHDSRGSGKLIREALHWMRRIQADRLVADQLQGAADAVQRGNDATSQ